MATDNVHVGSIPIKKTGYNSTNFLTQRIGCYSLRYSLIQATKEYMPDRSMLKYVRFPRFTFELDLTQGYDLLSKEADITSAYHGLDFLLKWILDNYEKLKLFFNQIPSASLNTDFVCFRGVLKEIMIIPYQNSEELLLYAMKFKGTIYIVLKDLKEEIMKNIKNSRLLSYTGHKFENYVCFHTHHCKIPIDEKHEFCCVFKSTLNEHSILYAAEIDAVLKKEELDKELELLNFVEIKTCARITNRHKHVNFCKYKLLKWWAQSYLAGIQTIFCGHRDNDLIVRHISQMTLEEIENMGKDYWKPNICLSFLDKFFTFVKSSIKEESTLYKFHFIPKLNVTCTRVNSEHEVLPDWYKQSFPI